MGLTGRFPLFPKKTAPGGAAREETTRAEARVSRIWKPGLVARVSTLAMFGEIEAVDLGLLVHPKAGNRLGDHQDDGADNQRLDNGDGDR